MTDQTYNEALTPAGVRVFYYDELDSTNNEARRLLDSGVRDDIWIVAKRQSLGRGRYERQWVSNPGNLFATFLWQSEEISKINLLPFAVGLAVRAAVSNVTDGKELIQLKWPNDVLINGKKASGILIEGQVTDFDRAYLIGVGINLKHFPTETIFPATSVADEFGIDVQVNGMVEALSVQLKHYLHILCNTPKQLTAEWKQYAWGMGSRHTFSLHDKIVTGRAETIEDDGALCVTLDEGEKIRLYAGDIFPLS